MNGRRTCLIVCLRPNNFKLYTGKEKNSRFFLRKKNNKDKARKIKTTESKLGVDSIYGL